MYTSTLVRSSFVFSSLFLISACETPYTIAQKGRPDLIDSHSSGDLENGQGRSGETFVSRLPGFNDDIKHDAGDELAPGYTASADLFHVDISQRKVDVLFVLDNSNSMSEEQESVINSFETFLQYFLDQNIDYHIGILSTDASLESANWSSSSYTRFPNNGAGSLLAYEGNPRFIDSTTSKEEAIRQFRENARLGVRGNPAETGVLSLLAALSPEKLSGWNQGFLRSDALLAMIVVSDEDEAISPDDLTYLRTNIEQSTARKNQFKSRLKQLKPKHAGLIRFDTVTAPSVSQCTSLGSSAGQAGTGDFYMDLAKDLSADRSNHIFNICNDFSQDLINIGSDLSVSVEREFELSQTPVGTIVVKLNGIQIQESYSNGWTYDARRNRVLLHGLNLDSERSFDVRINFVYR